MAQNFRNNLQRNVGTGDTTLLAAGDYDAVIGIRCCNILTSTIAIDVKIAKGGADYFLAKGVSIPPNSAIELIQGGAKTATNGDFTITFPDPTTPANAIISMS